MATDAPAERRAAEVLAHARWFARSFGRPDFPTLTADDVEAVAAAFDPVTFAAGAVVFRAGDPATGVYVVRQGTVYLRDGSGGRVLERLGAGAALGDAEAIVAGRYGATAEAYSAVGALRVPSDRFRELLTARPRLALRWLDAALRSREAARERIEQLLGGSVDARLCAALLELADARGYVYQTHEGLAELIGSRRETVSRGMARLRRRRVVETVTAGVVHVDSRRAAAFAAAASTRGLEGESVR